MKHTVREVELSNGAQGLLIDVPGSLVIDMEFVFHAGYIFGDTNKYDVPHVMEHLILKGTQQYPSVDQFHIELEKNGAYSNAYTDWHRIGYTAECSHWEYERVVGLMGELLCRPLFPKSAFATELRNVREELSRNTSNYSRVTTAQLEAKTMPLSRMEDDARLRLLDKIKYEDLVEHYRKTHTAANLRFCLAGDLSRKPHLEKNLEAALGELPRGVRQEMPKEPAVLLTEPILSNQTIKPLYYRIQAHFDQLAEPQRKALRLAGTILVGGWGSLIFGEVRKRGLAYHVGGGGMRTPAISAFHLGAYATPENSTEVFKVIVKHLEKLKPGR